MEHMKKVFCIYRTKDFTEADKIERNRQKELCQQFTDEKKWLLVCEFWQTENNIIDAPPSGDLFPLLCWAAKHRLFDILLVSEFDRVGRFPMECSTAAAFFEQHSVEVWSVDHGHVGKWLRIS